MESGEDMCSQKQGPWKREEIETSGGEDETSL